MARLSSTKIYGDLYVSGNIQNKATITTEGVVKLNNAINSTSATEAATPSAVKQAYDLANHGHPYRPSSWVPTKADVGLGSVNDWGATTAVNSTSTTTYATASAVKQAYDLANHSHPYIPASASCNKNWYWSGQGGQPNWLWGGNDGTNMYVYSPSNFHVNFSNTSYKITSRNGAADDGHYLYADRYDGWNARLKMGYDGGGISDSVHVAYASAASSQHDFGFKLRNIVLSTAGPSGGSSGEVWIKYT